MQPLAHIHHQALHLQMAEEAEAEGLVDLEESRDEGLPVDIN